MPVKDKGKWSVLNNMEFMDRVRLQPEWYHYWIWYKKVLGIKIPLPGLGLHDKYGKEDRRNFQLQEIPMMAAVEYNKSETEKEGYNVDTIYRQEPFKFGDKEIDYQYTLTKNRRNDILNDINKKLVEYSSNFLSPLIILKLSTPKYNNIKIAANACASAINSPNRTVVLSLSPSNNSNKNLSINSFMAHYCFIYIIQSCY